MRSREKRERVLPRRAQDSEEPNAQLATHRTGYMYVGVWGSLLSPIGGETQNKKHTHKTKGSRYVRRFFCTLFGFKPQRFKTQHRTKQPLNRFSGLGSRQPVWSQAGLLLRPGRVWPHAAAGLHVRRYGATPSIILLSEPLLPIEKGVNLPRQARDNMRRCWNKESFVCFVVLLCCCSSLGYASYSFICALCGLAFSTVPTLYSTLLYTFYSILYTFSIPTLLYTLLSTLRYSIYSSLYYSIRIGFRLLLVLCKGIAPACILWLCVVPMAI